MAHSFAATSVYHTGGDYAAPHASFSSSCTRLSIGLPANKPDDFIINGVLTGITEMHSYRVGGGADPPGERVWFTRWPLCFRRHRLHGIGPFQEYIVVSVIVDAAGYHDLSILGKLPPCRLGTFFGAPSRRTTTRRYVLLSSPPRSCTRPCLTCSALASAKSRAPGERLFRAGPPTRYMQECDARRYPAGCLIRLSRCIREYTVYAVHD